MFKHQTGDTCRNIALRANSICSAKYDFKSPRRQTELLKNSRLFLHWYLVDEINVLDHMVCREKSVTANPQSKGERHGHVTNDSNMFKSQKS